jgi:hypothetical protein
MIPTSLGGLGLGKGSQVQQACCGARWRAGQIPTHVALTAQFLDLTIMFNARAIEGSVIEGVHVGHTRTYVFRRLIRVGPACSGVCAGMHRMPTPPMPS